MISGAIDNRAVFVGTILNCDLTPPKDTYKFKLHCQSLGSLVGRQLVLEVAQVIFVRLLTRLMVRSKGEWK